MALYGDNLGKTIRPDTTWGQATDVLGILEDGIRKCYDSLTLWDNWQSGQGVQDTINLAILSVISPDDARTAKGQLDSELASLYANDKLVQQHGSEQGWDSPIGDAYAQILQGQVATASAQIALIDRLFHTSVITQVSDAIVPVVGDLSDKIANAMSKAVGNFLAGVWWIIALGLGALYLWHKWGHKVVT